MYSQDKIGFMLLPEQTLALDKQMHIAGGIYTSALGYFVTYEITNNKTKSAMVSVGAAALIGVIKEFADRNTTGWDNNDLIATISGSVLFNIVVII